MPSFEVNWLQTIPAPADSLQAPRALVVDWSRNLSYVSAFATGTVGTPGDFDVLIASYEAATGDLRWSKRLTGTRTGPDDSVGLALSEDATILYHVGNYLGGIQGPSPLTTATGPVRSMSIGVSVVVLEGTPVWERDHVNSPIPEGADMATSIMVGPNGGVFVSGWKAPDPNFAPMDIKLIVLRFDQWTGALTHDIESNDNLAANWIEQSLSIRASDDERRLYILAEIPPFRENDAWHYSLLAYNVLGPKT